MPSKRESRMDPVNIDQENDKLGLVFADRSYDLRQAQGFRASKAYQAFMNEQTSAGSRSLFPG
jgi:hypothetical protein